MLGPSACFGSGKQTPGTEATKSPTAQGPDPSSVVETVNCTAAKSADPPKDGWVYSAYLSQAEGLVVKDLRFGPRNVADEISVPYLRPIGFGSGIAHLSVAPQPGDGDLSSTLVGEPVCNPNGHDGVAATYQLTSRPSGLTFVVQQSYRFDAYDSATRCEASESVKCVRFWPTVTWGLAGSQTVDQSNRNVGLDVVERLSFDPDGLGMDSANITRDTPSKENPFNIDHLSHDGALMKEGAVVALTSGHIKKWENWHQTSREMVSLPGIPDALGGSGYAGCSECVHAHWSWFGDNRVRDAGNRGSPCHSPDCWTVGTPQILPASHQTACAGWVRSSTVVADGTDWCARAKNGWPSEESIDPRSYHGDLTFYWDAHTTGVTAPGSGVTINGNRFRVGDSYWPQLAAGDRTTGKELGDTGAMFIVPARAVPSTDALIKTEEPYYNSVAGSRLPKGWVVPVSVALRPGGDQGPYYLRVHTGGNLNLLNPAPDFSPENTGEPWVYIYDDDGRPDPNVTPDRTVQHPEQAVSTAPPVARPLGPADDPHPMYAYVVFDRQPQPSDDLNFQLDAAPDGVVNYVASTGLWEGQLQTNQFNGGDVPASFLGRWRGVLSYSGGDITASLSLGGGQLGTRIGTAEYPDPSQDCAENLALKDASSSRIVLRETYASGNPACTTWTIVLTQNGTTIHGEWYLGDVNSFDDPPDGTASLQPTP